MERYNYAVVRIRCELKRYDSAWSFDESLNDPSREIVKKFETLEEARREFSGGEYYGEIRRWNGYYEGRVYGVFELDYEMDEDGYPDGGYEITPVPTKEQIDSKDPGFFYSVEDFEGGEE